MDFRRKLGRWLFARFYRWYVFRRSARPSETRFYGHRLLTDPEVFHPVYFLSSRVLAASLRTFDLRGKRFLDMGTGSGPVGVVAAAAGAVVTGCDINRRAVALATENLRRNHLPAEVLESNLFSALAGRTFDVIAFNIPFYPKDPKSPLEAAFYAGNDLETVRHFAAGCVQHLEKEGLVVIVFSEDSGRDRILSIFLAAGLSVVHERVTHRLFDRFHTVSFRAAHRV